VKKVSSLQTDSFCKGISLDTAAVLVDHLREEAKTIHETLGEILAAEKVAKSRYHLAAISVNKQIYGHG